MARATQTILIAGLLGVWGCTAQRTDGPRLGSPVAPVGEVGGDVQGTWVGMFQKYPVLVRMDIDLRRSGPELRGEVAVETIEGQGFHIGGAVDGRVRVEGRWDDETRTFIVAGREWTETRSQMPGRLRLHGVYDERTEMLAMTLGSDERPSAYAVAVRPRQEAALLALADRFNIEKTGGSLSESFGRLFSGRRASSASRDDLSAWVSRFTEEYPDTDPRNTAIDAVVAMGIGLFGDEFFEPYFGKPFDELDAMERGRYEGSFRTQRGRENPLADRFGAFSRPFSRFQAPNVMVSVVAQRVLRSWRDDVLERIAAAQPGDVEVELLRTLGGTLDGRLALLLPSERNAARTSFEAHRARLVLPALVASRDAAIRAASGIGGIRALDGWRSTQAEPLSWLSEAAKAEMLGPLVDARSRVVDEVVERLREDLDRMPRGVEGMAEGADWRRRYRGVAEDLPAEAARSLEEDFVRLRGSQLSAAAPSLTRRAADAASPAELTAVLQRLTEEDWEYPALRPLAEVSAERTRMFQVMTILGRSEREIVMDRQRASLPGPPTGEELLVAVEAHLEVGNRIMRSAVERCRQGQLDTWTALMCLVQAGARDWRLEAVQSIVTRLRPISCRPFEPRSYHCRYQVTFHQNTRAFEGPWGAIMDMIQRAGAAEGDFVEVAQGRWRYEPIG